MVNKSEGSSRDKIFLEALKSSKIQTFCSKGRNGEEGW